MTPPPAPTWPAVAARWSIEPGVVAALAAGAAVYLRGRSRCAGEDGGRPALFGAALAVIAVALLSPLATYADALLAVHMVQHLLLALAAAPLLVAARPLVALRAGLGATTGQRAPWSSPYLGWVASAAAGWIVHFTPLFDLALRRAAVHAFEHALFLGAGVAFWAPILGARPLSHAARLLYLAVAMPQNTFLALAVYAASHPLYPTYARLDRAWGPSVLADQRLGGGLMWVAGDLTLLVAVLAVATGWAVASAEEASE